MLFEDKDGKLYHPEELDELSPYEIQEREFHLYDELNRGLEI